MRRAIIIGTVVIAVIVGAGWGVWRYAGLAGVSPVEGWIREYLVTVLRRHLNPKIEIGELDYEYPRTVVISQLLLTESDVNILTVKQVRLELAEIPQAGKPILIERIDLTSPTVQLVKSPDGGLVGWSHLLRGDAVPPGEQVEHVEPGMRVSDFMRLRHAGIRDGSLAYQSDTDRHSMILAGINADLETPAAAEGPGWYGLIGTLSRDELFKINLNGRVDVNTGDLVLNSLHMQGALEESRYSLFPASLQDLLRTHQVQGSLALDVSGAWSQSNVEQCKLKLTARLEHTRFAQGSQVLTSDRVDVGGDIDGHRIEANASGDVLAGMAEVHFLADPSEPQPAKMVLRLKEVDFAQLVGLMPDAARRTLDSMQARGRISGEFNATNLHNLSQIEMRGKASIKPLAFQFMGSDAAAPSADLNGTFAGEKLNLDVTTAAIQRGTDTLATSVHVKLTAEPAATVIAAQLNTAGGRLDGNFQSPQGTQEGLKYSARLDQVRIEEVKRLYPASSEYLKSIIAGALSGDFHGSWNPADASASSINGSLTLATGQLYLFNTSVPVSTPSMNVKYAAGRLDLDGRLNAAGGAISGNLGVDPQTDVLTASGKLESVSLATLLAASGERWNSSASGGAVLDSRLTGEFDLKIPMTKGGNSTVRVNLHGTQGHCLLGSVRIPIDECSVKGEMGGQQITAQLQMNLLSGRAEVEGTIGIDPNGKFSAGWRVNDIQLESLSRLHPGPHQGRYRGRLSGDGDIHFDLATWSSSLKGRGGLEIRQGRLIEFPVIQDIMKVVRPVLSLVSPADQDEARANFTIRPDCVESDRFDVSSSLIAIRGRGRVNYDGGLELVVHATAAPRLSALLGPLDKLLDDASGRLVTYRVGGTVENPSIRVDPLGVNIIPTK